MSKNIKKVRTEECKGNRGCVFFEEKLEKKRHKVDKKTQACIKKIDKVV